MSLADIITALEAEDPDRILPLGFHNPHSYRGDYFDLAFEPAENITIREMLTAARSAVGTTYRGWKGGDFTMDADSLCWLAEEGTASYESIGPTFMRLLLQQPADRDQVLTEAASVEEALRARLWLIEQALAPIDASQDPAGIVGMIGPLLDGPLHPTDVAAYRAARTGQEG